MNTQLSLKQDSDAEKAMKKYQFYDRLDDFFKAFDLENGWVICLSIVFWVSTTFYFVNRTFILAIDSEYFMNRESVYDIYDLPNNSFLNDELGSIRVTQIYNQKLRKYKFHATQSINRFFWYYDKNILNLDYLPEKEKADAKQD